VAAPLDAGLPPDLHLPAGFVIRLRALHPTTGADVAGVRVTNANIVVRDVLGTLPADDAPLPFLVPTDEA